MESDDIDVIKEQERMLLSMIVQGVEGIEEVFLPSTEKEKVQFFNHTSYRIVLGGKVEI